MQALPVLAMLWHTPHPNSAIYNADIQSLSLVLDQMQQLSKQRGDGRGVGGVGVNLGGTPSTSKYWNRMETRSL